jgi:hypothetical protein
MMRISIGIDLNSNTGIRLAAGNDKFGAEKPNENGTNTTSVFSVVGPWTKMVILTISMRRTTLKKSGMSRRNKVCA